MSQLSLQERLANAYLGGVYLIEMDVNSDLPPDLRSVYYEIAQALTKVDSQGDEGAVKASTRVMSDDDAQQLIKQIVALYDEVTRHLEPGN